MNPGIDPLAELRDIILPPDPSFWPPAFGWWVLTLLIILSVVLLIYSFRRLYTRFARNSVVQIVTDLQNKDSQTAVAELSILLRRVALTKFPRAQVAGLTGKKWLEFLDQSGETDQFTQGPGQLLVTAPYARQKVEDVQPLIDLCRAWVKKVL